MCAKAGENCRLPPGGKEVLGLGEMGWSGRQRPARQAHGQDLDVMLKVMMGLHFWKVNSDFGEVA